MKTYKYFFGIFEFDKAPFLITKRLEVGMGLAAFYLVLNLLKNILLNKGTKMLCIGGDLYLFIQNCLFELSFSFGFSQLEKNSLGSMLMVLCMGTHSVLRRDRTLNISNINKI